MTPEEFQRAVRVCTGTPLDDRMVKLTFKIFDEDGDGNLSHEEFMKVLFNFYFGIFCMISLLNFILIDEKCFIMQFKDFKLFVQCGNEN